MPSLLNKHISNVRNKKRYMYRDVSEARINYWVKNNQTCKGPDCKHKGKSSEELTAAKVHHNAQGLCNYCYHRTKYPPGRIIFNLNPRSSQKKKLITSSINELTGTEN